MQRVFDRWRQSLIGSQHPETCTHPQSEPAAQATASPDVVIDLDVSDDCARPIQDDEDASDRSV